MIESLQDEIYTELSESQIEQMRRRCQTDLYFLAKTVLGYNQIHYETHSALCNFLVNEPANRRMILMARGFLKSTIGTIADSIRLALCDPNTRILIANETFEKACDFLKEIKGHWEADTLLGMLFKELLPAKRSGPGSDWTQSSSSIARTRQSKESTWNCIGVGGTAVSAHYNRAKLDDLAGNAAKESEAAMQRCIRWSDSMPALLDNLDDPIDMIGTRKTMNDVYAYSMQKWRNRVRIFLREPLENGVSVFPKMRTEALMQIMEETPEEWASDYMNNPVGRGGVDWGRHLVQYFTLFEDKLTFWCPVKQTMQSWKLHELDIVITVDPNSGKPLAPDKAAIIVHGVSPNDEVFVLQSWAERPSPHGLVEKTWELAKRWRARVIGFEEAGQQNTLFYFLKYCTEKGEHFHVEPLKHKNRAKDLRIRTGLDSLLKSRRLFFQRDQHSLIMQISFHPQLSEHNWDEIDCLANGPQLYRLGVSEADQEEENEAIAKIELIRGITGYGVSCHRPISRIA